MSGKKIVILCDGTWNTLDQVIPTNVCKLKEALLPIDSRQVQQLVFYDQGIGTNGGFIDKYIGGATGMGISRNIKDCYQFLARHYQQGDEIYCFGFSRGAYTVRSFVGFVTSFGLLAEQELGQLDLLYDLYRESPAKRPHHKNFARVETLKARAITPRFKFIGVWDTVGALGAPTPLLGWISRKLWVSFHDTELRNADYAYHALAVDERREPFRPSIWTKVNDCKEMKQVWFSGAHSNVGGGYKDAGLSDTALVWMLKKAELRGLEFDQTYLSDPKKLQENYRGQLVDSYSSAYKIFGAYLRPIGQLHEDIGADKAGINEMMHESVVKRDGESLFTYNPRNTAYGLQNLPIEPG
jgi:uncharacterized protein (DUF2235 family)